MEPNRPSHSSIGMSEPGPDPRTYLRSSAYGHHEEPGINPSRILVFLETRFWRILLGFVSVLGAVTAVTILLPKTYESSASFLVEREVRASDGGGLRCRRTLEGRAACA